MTNMQNWSRLLAVIIFSPALFTTAETYKVRGFGERPFGPNETQSSACELAESLAKRDALARHFGEVVGQQTILDCNSSTQSATGHDCELFESTWSLISSDGFVKGNENRQQEINFSKALKANVCAVTATFLIEEFVGAANPAFVVEINNKTGAILREGERAKLSIASSIPAYHVIYNWSPYIDQNNYYLIYPNDLDVHDVPVLNLTVPSDKRIADYFLEASLPPDLSSSSEYLILVSFLDKPRAVPAKLSQENFMAWLQSHERSRWSKKKYSYRVIGE